MNLPDVLGAKGFRPFFLLAGLHAAVMAPLWLLVLDGTVVLRGPLQGVTWHAHEMLFGFTMAVIAGFLLTAAENWTGLPTIRGVPLLALAGTWLAGRIALVAVPGPLGAVLDLAVVPVLVLGLGRPLVAAKSHRNLQFPVMLTALWLANLAVHLDAAGYLAGMAANAHRVAVYVIAVIMLVMAGRIVPMFTRNATGRMDISGSPRLDRIAIGATAGVALLHAVQVPLLLPWVAGVAGVATVARMRGWASAATLREPLLWVLHLGHFAIGLGLLLLAAQPLVGVPVGAAIHAVTVGGIGLLTIGMMARVSLGHSGRPLRVAVAMRVAFGSVALALCLRVLGPWLDAPRTMLWLWASAAAWSLGFVVFSVSYLPILTTPRADGKPG